MRKEKKLYGLLMLSMLAGSMPTAMLPVMAQEQRTAGNTDLANAENQSDFVYIEDNARPITNGIHLNNNGDNCHAVLNCLDKPATAFSFSADALFDQPEGDRYKYMSGGLTYNVGSKKAPNMHWGAVNVDSARSGNDDLFRVFGPGIPDTGAGLKEVDFTKPIHFQLDMEADGSFVYTFGNEGNIRSMEGKVSGWNGGYVGLLTWQSSADFTNIKFIDRSPAEVPAEKLEVTDNWHTNLSGLTYKGGEWKVQDDGLYSNAVDQGDCFLMSQSTGRNFIYQTDVRFLKNQGAASLIFRFNNNLADKQAYVVNIDGGNRNCKLWRWDGFRDSQTIGDKAVPEADTYTLKVVAAHDMISYYVNDILVGSSSNYLLNKGDNGSLPTIGQKNLLKEGCFGILNWNGEMVFQNTKYQELEEQEIPSVANIEVKSTDGEIKHSQFFEDAGSMLQYVNHAINTATIDVQAGNGANVVIRDASGKVCENGVVSLGDGNNIFHVTASIGDAAVTYSINIYRYGPEDSYYSEPYRDQYHYSVKENWANDPNGMIHYNGKWHLFYQHYADDIWGPMHWAHAVSTDQIHWTEEPVAFAPDLNGAMFSGCMVADNDNTSGLFSTSKGGMIAYITMDGGGQRIKMATSEDEGKTWKKHDVILDWSDDVLGTDAFRDPQVFKWEGKWFMVVAGGPLRIYSSNDLVHWTIESAYGNLHTECPAIFPAKVDGKVKWILDRGGRYYKVGDFKPVDGKWRFVPDEAYKNEWDNGIMNFGKDSYAAMAYYEDDFGTSENPNIPEELTVINWMNTWENYCNDVARKVGQKFNGTFNLQLAIGLTKNEQGTYVLTQTPIKAYEALRGTEPVIKTSVKAGEGQKDPLENFRGNTYELIASFKPEAGTKKVGFDLLSNGKGQKTSVLYDIESDTITMDRSKSGTIITDEFAKPNSQNVNAVKKQDGTIDFHIYVDKASVEVFMNDYTVAGAQQVFPEAGSTKAAVVVEGTPCKVDLSVTYLKSIWNEDTTVLQKAIYDAGVLNPNSYTSASYQIVKDALTAAQNVLNNSSSSQNQIDAAAAALKDAIKNLKYAGNGGGGNGGSANPTTPPEDVTEPDKKPETKPETSGSLVETDKGTQFKKPDGSLAKEEFATVKGKDLYFDKDGYMVKGWKEITTSNKKSWYYFDQKDGTKQTGWSKLAWNNTQDWYHFDSEGRMQTGWQKLNWNNTSKWYYFDQSGKMKNGWMKLDWMGQKDWYFFGPDGGMITGWKQIKTQGQPIWYHFDSAGKMSANGWKELSWNGKKAWYYFDQDGKMASNTTINGYKVDASGAWVK